MYDPRQQPPVTPPQFRQSGQPTQQYQQSQYQQQPQPQFQPRHQSPAPRRKPNKGLRVFAWGSVSFLLLVVLIIVLSTRHGGSPTGAAASTPAASASAHAAKTPAGTSAKAASACFARPAASGDIYVRTVIPGAAAQAQELGGGYAWDYAAGKCLNSVDYTIASAANGPGDCTTVGYVADNPGYNANATPAAPLKNVDGVAGSGC